MPVYEKTQHEPFRHEIKSSREAREKDPDIEPLIITCRGSLTNKQKVHTRVTGIDFDKVDEKGNAPINMEKFGRALSEALFMDSKTEWNMEDRRGRAVPITPSALDEKLDDEDTTDFQGAAVRFYGEQFGITFEDEDEAATDDDPLEKEMPKKSTKSDAESSPMPLKESQSEKSTPPTG